MSNALRVLIANEEHFRCRGTAMPSRESPAEAETEPAEAETEAAEATESRRIAKKQRRRLKVESEGVMEAIENRFHVVWRRGLRKGDVSVSVLRFLLRNAATNQSNARTAELLRAMADELSPMAAYWMLHALGDWLASSCVDIGSRSMLEMTVKSFCEQHPRKVSFALEG